MHVGINRAHGWSRARRAAARRTATGCLFRQPLLPPPQRSLIACIRAARSLTAGLVQLAGFLTFLRVLIACISLYQPVSASSSLNQPVSTSISQHQPVSASISQHQPVSAGQAAPTCLLLTSAPYAHAHHRLKIAPFVSGVRDTNGCKDTGGVSDTMCCVRHEWRAAYATYPTIDLAKQARGQEDRPAGAQ